MEVVRESSITRSIESSIANLMNDITIPRGCFRGCDAMGCLQRGAIDARQPQPYSPRIEELISLLGSMDIFNVVGSHVYLTDAEAHLYAHVDLTVETSGEVVIVMLREASNTPDMTDPLNGDVFDMITGMYLSGIHSGLIIYFSGKKIKAFFVNPDQKAYKELLELIISGSQHLYACELRGEVPAGSPGNRCTGCPYGIECESAIIAHGGNLDSRKAPGINREKTEDENRPEEGKQSCPASSE